MAATAEAIPAPLEHDGRAPDPAANDNRPHNPTIVDLPPPSPELIDAVLDTLAKVLAARALRYLGVTPQNG